MTNYLCYAHRVEEWSQAKCQHLSLVHINPKQQCIIKTPHNSCYPHIHHIYITHTHTHIHNRLTTLCPGLPGWAGTRKVKPIWILLKQHTVSWQWHQLGHMQVCTLLQTDNHASSPPLSFFTGQMPFLLPNQHRQSTEGNIYIGATLTSAWRTLMLK